MVFMAEYEVEELQDRFDPVECPNLAAGARALGRLMRWTNSCSDGWAYWQLPQKAATRLMDKLVDASAEQRKTRQPIDDWHDGTLVSVLRPVRQFLSQRGEDPGLLDDPEEVPPPPRSLSLGEAQELHVLFGGPIETAHVDYDGDLEVVAVMVPVRDLERARELVAVIVSDMEARHGR